MSTSSKSTTGSVPPKEVSSSNKTLPPKENALFKRILRCYEQKLYKNGLKFAKQILSNPAYQEHAETLAMKGLILNALGRRELAYEYVRRGLRNDLRSHTCWHVYGLLQRSERKYDEAIKCYRNALKWDPTNIQILRELSIVQIHIRDLKGYRDTRHDLFKLKPAQRASWIGFAMAYHLLHEYDMAYKILEAFRKTLNAKEEVYDYENSELLLYQNTVLQESGKTSAALSHLILNMKHIYDKTTVNELLGKLNFELDDLNAAQKIYKDLVQSNPDNLYYYRGLENALGISSNSQEKLKLYSIYRSEYPRAFLPRRLPLNCSSGEEFLFYLRPYVEDAFTKGAPPLFTDLKPLYTDPEKVQIIRNLVESMVENLTKNSHYGEGNVSPAPASALLWAYYYLAQHHNYARDTETALKYINKAIDHTPTLIELFICKAKIYKRAGDFVEAAECMEEAREMDTADRYINSKSAKYLLRANKIEAATNVCGKFTREGANVLDNLNEMQCMWFQTECALAYQRTGQWGESLKKCHEIDRHFTEIIDDQYDFHTYCLRKMTLRSYLELLRLENVLRSHPFYFKAAKCAIEVYIHLYDHPLQFQSTDEQTSSANMSASEMKKLKNKQRKAKKKAELEQQAAQQAAEKKEQHAKSKQNTAEDTENHPPPSEELLPEKLASTSDPLGAATRFLQPLQAFARSKNETHFLAYEIYSRKDKPLLMLQSIKRAFILDPNHTKLKSMMNDFSQKMSKSLKDLPEPLPKFIADQMSSLKVKFTNAELEKAKIC